MASVTNVLIFVFVISLAHSYEDDPNTYSNYHDIQN